MGKTVEIYNQDVHKMKSIKQGAHVFFFSKRKCSSICKCKNCQNGGHSDPVPEAGLLKSKNTYKTSMRYAAEKGEDTQACLSLNFVECFMLHEVMQVHKDASVDVVRNTYNDVCQIANMLFVDIPLQTKSEKDIKKGMQSLEINKEIVMNVNTN